MTTLIGAVLAYGLVGCGGAQPAAPRVSATTAALDCRFEDVPGSIRIFTPAPLPPSPVRHEKLVGTYILVRAGQTTRGRFIGTRHNDYADLSVTLDDGGWLSTPRSRHWLPVPEQANEAVPGSISFDREAPISISCTGQLVQDP